jgi:hypothetical protein
MSPSPPRRPDAEVLRARHPRLQRLLGTALFEALVRDATRATTREELDPDASLARLLAAADLASLGIPPRLAADLAAVERASAEVAALPREDEARLHAGALGELPEARRGEAVLHLAAGLRLLPVAHRLGPWREPAGGGPEPAPGRDPRPQAGAGFLAVWRPADAPAEEAPRWLDLVPAEGRALALLGQGLSLGEVTIRAGRWFNDPARVEALLAEWCGLGLFASLELPAGRPA